jgi:hypothetical protein
MKQILLISLFAVVLFFSSCLDESVLPEFKSENASNMNELRVSESFDWKTTKTIQITITGLPVLPNTNASKSTLTLKGKNDIYYSGFHAINENLNFTTTVPATETQIKLKFGSIEKTVSIENNKAAFSLIPQIND